VPEGGATIAGALSAVTVKTAVVAAARLSPWSESERDKESGPTDVVLGLSVRPLKAAFRLAVETVNDAEPLVSVVKVEPLAHTNVSIPSATDGVSESVLTPAAALAKLAAWLLPVEETSDRFSLIDSVAGAAIT
jgi:hypothetical protein